MKVLYTAAATATGGRNGQVKSSDGVLDLEVRMPKALGGAQDGYTNPEQLFAAGYAACFDSALNLVIKTAKISTGTTTISAEVSIGPNETGGFGLAVKLAANIPGVDQQQAEELVAKAHQICPYSNATRGNIEVELSVSNND
ncbi:organic hydroperoxide resistance protein [Pedobacter steynii]|uniref:Organic hydroperoxide resistance protein n=1 Tax=Pedobacter steynii TaxID=430522 RepID=A0A1D7QMX2_9SPHI|nr:organic hydroperoxide resistance protein [Pedobacter steynii]AOM79979.1 organic hydroperoxide resistance protein [Pedobacter steynii]